MKIFTKIIGLAAGVLLIGCNALNNLTPTQVTAIGTVITQVTDEGAVYAIQQDPSSATYFKAAIPVLDNFANGTDLSPAALQTALSNTPYGTNQWVEIAITTAVTVYDVSYSQYISNQLTNTPYAKVWIQDVELGFKEATSVSLNKDHLLWFGRPDFVVDGKVYTLAIKARVHAAATTK